MGMVDRSASVSAAAGMHSIGSKENRKEDRPRKTPPMIISMIMFTFGSS